MPPYVYLAGTTFQYVDREAYWNHMITVSPSEFVVVSRSFSDYELLHNFNYLGEQLYRHTERVLYSGGLFHLREFARKMMEIDQELLRRAGSGDWTNADLSRIRPSLATIASITILPPPAERSSRGGRMRDSSPLSAPPPPFPSNYRHRDNDPEIRRRVEDDTSGTGTPNRPRSRPSWLDWLEVETRDTNIAPGVNATPDGRTSIGGVFIGRVGQAGNFDRMAQQWQEEGARDAEIDFRSTDNRSARQRRLQSSRYGSNVDYRYGYNGRWRQLERQ